MIRKRKKSIYFDKYTRHIGKATCMPSYPAARPHRYMFVGYFWYQPTFNNKRVKQWLERNNIIIPVDKDLPF